MTSDTPQGPVTVVPKQKKRHRNAPVLIDIHAADAFAAAEAFRPVERFLEPYINNAWASDWNS